MIELLLRHGADVNYRSKLRYDENCDRTTSGKCTFRGQTALTRAATEEHYTIVKLLLENGANPLLPREDGKSPRQVACDWKHIDVAKLIKKYEDKTHGVVESEALCSENYQLFQAHINDWSEDNFPFLGDGWESDSSPVRLLRAANGSQLSTSPKARFIW